MTSLRVFRSRILLVFLGLVAIVVLTIAFKSRAADKPTPGVAKAALTVSTVTPSSAEWPFHLTGSGSITAWQEAIVGSEIGGLRLIEVAVNVGDRVRKGQVLARLQSDTVEAERDQTRASLAEAEASFAEAQANANRARQVEASGALSAQQIAQYLTAELTANARVAVLNARLKSDQLRLAQTRILASDDGTISARTATLGAVMQQGQELFRLIRKDRLEWRAELPAGDLARIRPGMPVSIVTASKSKVPGHVRMVGPTLDPQTRNGLVYVDIDSNGAARAGMFASGEIEIARGKVLALPQSAVLLRDGFHYVFRLGQDNHVIQTKIGLGQRSGDLVAVTGGLEPGAPVVGTGVGFLADGDLVRVVSDNAVSTPVK
jgi:RND family efflux transporter MFP subunit